jgi:hypothetical protein
LYVALSFHSHLGDYIDFVLLKNSYLCLSASYSLFS